MRALEVAACQWHAFSNGSQHPVDVGFEPTGVERRPKAKRRSNPFESDPDSNKKGTRLYVLSLFYLTCVRGFEFLTHA